MIVWDTVSQAKELAQSPSAEVGRACFVLTEQLSEFWEKSERWVGWLCRVWCALSLLLRGVT